MCGKAEPLIPNPTSCVILALYALIRTDLVLEIRLHSCSMQREILHSLLHLWGLGLLVCEIWLSALAPDFNFCCLQVLGSRACPAAGPEC